MFIISASQNTTTPTKRKINESTELIGYIESLSPVQTSKRNNSFCDVQLCCNHESKKVRVMANYNTNMNLFMSKCEAKSPIKMTDVSPTKGGLYFFNTNTGSRMIDEHNVSFKYKANKVTEIKNINTLPPKSLINVGGNLRWLEETRTVMCGKDPQKSERSIRSALLADENGYSIKISIWGDHINKIDENVTYNIKNVISEDYYGIRLATTSNSTFTIEPRQLDINWDDHDITPSTINLCCPDIQSVKVNKFLQCKNRTCKRKVSPYPGDDKVKCENPTCRRKMLVSKCIKSVSVEITFSEKDNPENEHCVFFCPNACY